MARWLVATLAAAGSVLLLGLFARLMRENQAKVGGMASQLAIGAGGCR
jgi:hypothetical protein